MSSPVMVKTKTPGIYKRGGRYVVTYRDPSGHRRKRFAKTYAEARRVKAALKTDVDRGEYRESSRVTFAEYAAGWIETYPGRTSKGIREETRRDYRARLEQDAIPVLGRMRLSEIEARDLDALAAHVARRGVKANTVRLALAPVKALLATAHQRGDLRVNPAAGYRTRHTQPDDANGKAVEVKALTEDELAQLLTKIPNEWRLFFEFLAKTGLRIGEAIEIRWSDIDLGERWLHVKRRYYRGRVGAPKSKYGRRRVRLTADLARSLWQLRARTHGGDDDLVFTSEHDHRIDQGNLMSRVLKPAAVNAGLGEWVQTRSGRRAESWVGFHTFRHTCATTLFRSGWNAVQVQRWLGHHKPSFTLDVYVHLLDEDTPDPDFLDDVGAGTVGNKWATQQAETGRNDEPDEPVETPPFAAETLVAVRAG